MAVRAAVNARASAVPQSQLCGLGLKPCALAKPQNTKSRERCVRSLSGRALSVCAWRSQATVALVSYGTRGTARRVRYERKALAQARMRGIAALVGVPCSPPASAKGSLFARRAERRTMARMGNNGCSCSVVQARGARSEARAQPNPSIERTVKSRLRLLSPAAHVER